MPPATTGAPVLEVHDLAVGYQEQLILRGVSLQIMAGRIVTIIGGSGCGKSTLLKAVLGLIEPQAGDIRLFGQHLTDQDERGRAAVLRQIGMLFQNGALLNSIPVADNVALPLVEHTDLPPAVVAEIVRTKLAQVGLAHAGALLPSQLSGGMRKRAGLARAMALDPALLFCDEPSAGLDPVTSAGIDRLLLQLRAAFGMTIVVVTHELASIRAIADHVVMLGGGRKLFDGTLQQALTSTEPAVRSFFLREEPEAAGHA